MLSCENLSSVKSRITLSDGHTMPCVGFGTWMIKDDLNGTEPILKAIEAGYRHIDTASLYNSERSVGEAMRLSGLHRDEFFITTKVWKDDLEDGKIRISLEKSLSRLGMDYVDLFLIHWPRADYDDLNWAARRAPSAWPTACPIICRPCPMRKSPSSISLSSTRATRSRIPWSTVRRAVFRCRPGLP